MRRTGYEHLAWLFAESAALPEGHPERQRLRSELIAGYLPVARYIARKYGDRGESPQDLEHVASLGLILGVDRFDPGRDVDLLSFAIPTISGECCATSATAPPRSACPAGCARCTHRSWTVKRTASNARSPSS